MFSSTTPKVVKRFLKVLQGGVQSQGLPSECEFSAFRHFFKTSMAQSVAELVLYSQKNTKCGHFLSNLVN